MHSHIIIQVTLTANRIKSKSIIKPIYVYSYAL